MPSLYEITVPVFVQKLGVLDHLLAKAVESGMDDQAVLDARLAPDMLPLVRQVQIACDTAKLAITRLAQVAPRAMPDEETPVAQLRERIAKTIAFVESIKPEQLEGDINREIVLKFPNGSMNFTAQSFLLTFSLPNFIFHVTTAYDLLRSAGVPLGKMDFLAGAGTGA